jgi:hypothetical protein
MSRGGRENSWHRLVFIWFSGTAARQIKAQPVVAGDETPIEGKIL